LGSAGLPNLDASLDTGDVGDEEVAAVARRYRRAALATLITVARNERAPASARAQAASRLLEYSDGKPAQARPPVIADLATMPLEQRMQLWNELTFSFNAEEGLPAELQRMLNEAYEYAVQRQAERQGARRDPNAPDLGSDEPGAVLPRPNRYTRGNPEPPSPHRLQREPIIRPGGAPLSAPLAASLGNPDRGAQVEGPVIVGPPAASTVEPPEGAEPDNVIPLNPPLPRGCHPLIRQPAPSPIGATANTGGISAIPAGGVHPDVLARSTLPPAPAGNGGASGMALDAQIWGASGWGGYPWRPGGRR
jgi:hypothetical protein